MHGLGWQLDVSMLFTDQHDGHVGAFSGQCLRTKSCFCLAVAKLLRV
jgi:hypothetical protein